MIDDSDDNLFSLLPILDELAWDDPTEEFDPETEYDLEPHGFFIGPAKLLSFSDQNCAVLTIPHSSCSHISKIEELCRRLGAKSQWI